MPRNNFLQLITKLQGLWQEDTAGMMALAREDIVDDVVLPAHQWQADGARQLVANH